MNFEEEKKGAVSAEISPQDKPKVYSGTGELEAY
jgi:hypothetical protein